MTPRSFHQNLKVDLAWMSAVAVALVLVIGAWST